MRGGSWFTPVAVTAAGAEVLLIALGPHVAFPWLLVWVPAVTGLALAAESFRRATRQERFRTAVRVSEAVGLPALRRVLATLRG